MVNKFSLFFDGNNGSRRLRITSSYKSWCVAVSLKTPAKGNAECVQFGMFVGKSGVNLGMRHALLETPSVSGP